MKPLSSTSLLLAITLYTNAAVQWVRVSLRTREPTDRQACPKDSERHGDGVPRLLGDLAALQSFSRVISCG